MREPKDRNINVSRIAVTLLMMLLALTAAAVCNTAPVAVTDLTSTYDQLIVVDPLANDVDAEGQVLTVTLQTWTCLGTVSVDAFGLVSFQPSQPLTADCQIGYRVRDELGLSDTENIVVEAAAPPALIFRDDFESGNVSAWFECTGC